MMWQQHGDAVWFAAAAAAAMHHRIHVGGVRSLGGGGVTTDRRWRRIRQTDDRRGRNDVRYVGHTIGGRLHALLVA